MISVIVPIYNVEKYLKKCIDSIMRQTYSDIEIILVNDGSTDRSGTICDHYAKLDNRIKVVHKKNGGLSDARNVGIDIATGEYISFIDSDDWIDKEFLSTLYKLIKDNDAEISICSFKRCISENEILNDLKKIKVYNNIEALKEIYSANYLNMIIACNKLYKIELFDKIRYPKGKIHEDEYVTPLILFKSKKVVYTLKELLFYRETPNSITKSKFNIKRLDYFEALKNRGKLYKEEGLEELYKENVHSYVLTYIIYYYKIKYSDIDNKQEIMMKLKSELKSYKEKEFKSINEKDKIAIFAFLKCPYIFEKIYNRKFG